MVNRYNSRGLISFLWLDGHDSRRSTGGFKYRVTPDRKLEDTLASRTIGEEDRVLRKVSTGDPEGRKPVESLRVMVI